MCDIGHDRYAEDEVEIACENEDIENKKETREEMFTKRIQP